MHLQQGRSVLATVADHVVPHRGDEALFFEGDLQSLCKDCHDSVKQRDENRGYSTACGVDGWPLDPNHPMWTDDFGPLGQTKKKGQT
jgi:hypothetical protein